MSDEWSTNTNDWAIADEGVYVNNPEYIYVKTDVEGKFLFGIKVDGEPYFGVGCPEQVQKYVENKITDLPLDEYDNIVTFLSDYLGSDTTLNIVIDNLANTKVDKVEGQSLINTDYALSQGITDSPEYLQITTDSESKILEGIKTNGTKEIISPIDTPSATIEHIENPEWLSVTMDAEKKVLEGTKEDGKHIPILFTDKSTTDTAVINQGVDVSLVARKKLQADIGVNEGNWMVPDYYNNTGYLAHKTRIISDMIRKTIINGDAFYFITDTHWEINRQHSPAIIKQMDKILNIPRLFHGGDLYHLGLSYDGYNVEAVNAYRNSLYHTNKVYFTDGNHEYIVYDGIGAKYGDVFAETKIYLDDVVFGGANKNYYYINNYQKKIRYISLYTWGEWTGTDYIHGFEDTNQLTWFRDVALNVESGWKIIIFSHGLVWLQSPLVGGFMYTQGYNNIANIVNNYQGNGEIVAFICGHSHHDSVHFEIMSCPVIVTTSDMNAPIEGVGYIDFYDLSEARTDGTVNEQAFDVVVYNTDDGIFHFCRIGSRALNRSNSFNNFDGQPDNNKQVDYRSVFQNPINVGDTIVLETCLDGTLIWESANSSVISVNNGTITVNDVGDTVITATSDNGEIQSFFIKVSE